MNSKVLREAPEERKSKGPMEENKMLRELLTIKNTYITSLELQVRHLKRKKEELEDILWNNTSGWNESNYNQFGEA